MSRDHDRPHVIAALGKASFYGLTNYPPAPMAKPPSRASTEGAEKYLWVQRELTPLKVRAMEAARYLHSVLLHSRPLDYLGRALSFVRSRFSRHCSVRL